MGQWEKWIPIDKVPQEIYLDSFVDDGNEGIIMTFISCEDGEKKVLVQFEGHVLSYRNTDEGSLLKTWEFLGHHYGVDFHSRWPFFKVKNSEYLNWFLKESCGIYDLREVQHYVFLTPDDIVEVLSLDAPSVVIE